VRTSLVAQGAVLAGRPLPLALEATALVKWHGDVHALRGVDLCVVPGEILALLGRNGAGKTTFVSIVSGLLRPDAGTVHIAGVDLAKNPRCARSLLGVAPQQLGVYPVLTVRQNLQFFGESAGLSRRSARQRTLTIAETLGLTHLLDRGAGALSGGEQRRLHTAAALLHSPPLVLLDEPTVGADAETRERVLQAVRDLADAGTAVVYTTHYLPEVEALSTKGAELKVAILEQGEVLVHASLAELVATHSTTLAVFTFDGPPPLWEELSLDGLDISPDGRERSSDSLSLATHNPGSLLPGLLARLGSHADRLCAVDLVRPSLERAYAGIIGHGARDTHTAGSFAETGTGPVAVRETGKDPVQSGPLAEVTCVPDLAEVTCVPDLAEVTCVPDREPFQGE